jgi:hypothetical protein
MPSKKFMPLEVVAMTRRNFILFSSSSRQSELSYCKTVSGHTVADTMKDHVLYSAQGRGKLIPGVPHSNTSDECTAQQEKAHLRREICYDQCYESKASGCYP